MRRYPERVGKTDRTVKLTLVPRAGVASLGTTDTVLQRIAADGTDLDLIRHRCFLFLPVTSTVSPRGLARTVMKPALFSQLRTSFGV